MARSALITTNYSCPVLGISGGDPSFRDDDGAADPAVSAALAAFAAGHGGEHEVMTAVAASRLLVPVVPVPAGSVPDGPVPGGDKAGEKATEMALPTLIGMDGRRALPVFTCLAAVRRWQPVARPVPVAARQVWVAATEECCAVVIDVAGPVAFAVEGARLAALAGGEAPLFPWTDPDVRQIVAGVLVGYLDVASFALRPAKAEADLAVVLTLADEAAGGGAGHDLRQLAASVGDEIMARLGGRFRRGVQVWLGLPVARGQGASSSR